MKFKEPFSHKCPVCLDDIYTQHRQYMFEFILRNSEFHCKKCNSLLKWKQSYSLILLRVGFLLLILTSLLVPIVASYLKYDLIYIQVVIVIGAISAILFMVNMLFLEVELVKGAKSKKCK